MARYRSNLPLLSDRVFLTDGGAETTLIFLEGVDLPHFAAFDLLRHAAGTEILRSYYNRYASIAVARGVGFVLESPTWRASRDWGRKLGYGDADLGAINRDAIALMMSIRDVHETAASPMVVSGCIGPRGDGYVPGRLMSVAEARDYHGAQAETFAAAGADMISAMTINNVEEATGIVLAAKAVDMPVVISFTLETDGRLPDGSTLAEAIGAVDRATARTPVYYGINCAHPTHFAEDLAGAEDWNMRIRGLRANASTRSHAELDEAADLDDGDPVALGRSYAALRRRMPWLSVLGGCCGTDHRHVEQICLACLPETPSAAQSGRNAA